MLLLVGGLIFLKHDLALFGLHVLVGSDQKIGIIPQICLIEGVDEAFVVEASLQSQNSDDFIQVVHF